MAFPIGYQVSEAQEMMTLSAIAYAAENSGNYGTIQQAIESELAASSTLGGNYKLVWLGVTSDFANLMYVVRDSRETARFAVAVRGTDWNFLDDWNDDFNVIYTHGWPTASPPDASIYVAKGAWDGMQALLGTTSNNFNMVPPAIPQPSDMMTLFTAEALWNTYDTDIDIFVTGHSLGGAMATAIGLWMADTASKWVLRPNKVNFKTYTFAAPTVGNQAFADYYNGQTANTQVQWQAFRVYNAQDAIPHAYQYLGNIPEDGVPLSPGFALLELIPAITTVQVALQKYNVAYVDVGTAAAGTAVALNNNPPSTTYPPSCPNPASNWSDFACWVGYEHDHNLYLVLLGAATVPIAQAAVDVASISATPLRSVVPVGEIATPEPSQPA